MKKLIVFLCLFFTIVTLHARAIREEYRAADEKAIESYAFGMIIGSELDLGSLGLDFDYNALAEGLKAMVKNTEPLLTFQEAIDIVDNALHNAMVKIAEENILIEEEFFMTNSRQPGVMWTESGMQYVIIRETDGEKPAIDSVVKVNYTGTFIDGDVFDSSPEDGAYIPLEMVIPGWAEGLMLMSVGSVYRLYIPSYLAYGENGIRGVIPPYSTLIFMVELLEIVDEDFNPFSLPGF